MVIKFIILSIIAIIWAITIYYSSVFTRKYHEKYIQDNKINKDNEEDIIITTEQYHAVFLEKDKDE